MKKTISVILLSIFLTFCLSGCFLIEDYLGISTDDSDCVDNYSKTMPYINETLINIHGVEFTVTEVTNHSFLSNGSYDITPEADGANFVWITIEIYNGSRESFSVNPNNFKLIKSTDNGSVSYEYSSKTYYLPDRMTSTDLGPELKKTFNILFEVPTKTTQDTYKLFCDPVKVVLPPPEGAVNNIILKNR